MRPLRRRLLVVATTIDTQKMGRTAETMVKTTQQSTYTAMDYAAKAQEVNVDLLRKTAEIWIEGLRKQTELSQEMAQEVFEKAEDQGYAAQDFFKQWGFPLSWQTPYDPFGLWGEWAQAAQKVAWATEQTGRVIETTAPSDGSSPIAGYDEMNVGEISRRLETLTPEQLERVRDYEKQHKNRGTLVHEMERKIEAVS